MAGVLEEIGFGARPRTPLSAPPLTAVALSIITSHPCGYWELHAHTIGPAVCIQTLLAGRRWPA